MLLFVIVVAFVHRLESFRLIEGHVSKTAALLGRLQLVESSVVVRKPVWMALENGLSVTGLRVISKARANVSAHVLVQQFVRPHVESSSAFTQGDYHSVVALVPDSGEVLVAHRLQLFVAYVVDCHVNGSFC